MASLPSRDSSDMMRTSNSGFGFNEFIIRMNPGRSSNSAPLTPSSTQTNSSRKAPALLLGVGACVFELPRDRTLIFDTGLVRRLSQVPSRDTHQLPIVYGRHSAPNGISMREPRRSGIPTRNRPPPTRFNAAI